MRAEACAAGGRGLELGVVGPGEFYHFHIYEGGYEVRDCSVGGDFRGSERVDKVIRV